MNHDGFGERFFVTHLKIDLSNLFLVVSINCRFAPAGLLRFRCTVSHKSRDPGFHSKYMEAGVMTFAAHCNLFLVRTTIRNVWDTFPFSGSSLAFHCS